MTDTYNRLNESGHYNIDALLDRALTAEARVAQLERAIADDPLESQRLRAELDDAHDEATTRRENFEIAISRLIAAENENARLRALIAEALDMLHAGHEPGEYAESVWIAGMVNTLKEADHGSPRPEP